MLADFEAERAIALPANPALDWEIHEVDDEDSDEVAVLASASLGYRCSVPTLFESIWEKAV